MSLPRIVFAGTPDFSVPCLSALIDSPVNVVGVFTQPDRVAGRGKKLQQSPVKQCAIKAGIEVFQPLSFKHKKAREALIALKPDLMVVVAYGLILPQAVLDIPAIDCVNVHASLLPRWRGAAPIQRAIEAGDMRSGVCLMQMEKGLDTGPVLACSDYKLAAQETGGSLHGVLSDLGASLLSDNLQAILAHRLMPELQSEQGVSYAHKLSKQDSQIDWKMNAQQLENKIRAFNPWPIMVTKIEDKIIRLHKAVVIEQQQANGQVGEILAVSAQGIEVQTQSGVLKITELQKPAGKILAARDFLNGFKLTAGQRFE